MEAERAQEILTNAVRELQTIFPFTAIVIAGTFEDDQSQLSALVKAGSGNWYAQYGMLKYMVAKYDGEGAEEGARSTRGDDE